MTGEPTVELRRKVDESQSTEPRNSGPRPEREDAGSQRAETPRPRSAPLLSEADPDELQPDNLVETGQDGSAGHPILRWAAGVLANVTVLTALLVYFGWQRNEVHARELGIDESLLGMSTTDYVLRSVGPAWTLLLVVGIGGLAWLQLDHALAPRARTNGTTDRLVRYGLRTLSLAWAWCPAVVWALGFIPALIEPSYVAFPPSFGAGILLTLYGTHLRNTLPGAVPRTGMPLLYTFAAVIVCVTLFWGIRNYAIVNGAALAKELVVTELSSVTVYSTQRLNLAVGKETTLPGAKEKDAYGYRYSDLRLLTYIGGQYFLIADDWRPRRGVVVILRESAAIRLELGRP